MSISLLVDRAGFEPATSCTSSKCSTAALTVLLLVPTVRIELTTSPLPRECSATEPRGQNTKTYWCNGKESNLRLSINSGSKTTELLRGNEMGSLSVFSALPLSYHCICTWRRVWDSNPRGACAPHCFPGRHLRPTRSTLLNLAYRNWLQKKDLNLRSRAYETREDDRTPLLCD